MKKKKQGRKKKLGKSGSGASHANQLRESILAFFYRHDSKKYTAFQIIKKLRIKQVEQAVAVLEELTSRKMLYRTEAGKYALEPGRIKSSGSRTYEGYVDRAKAGHGFLICKEFQRDIYISPKNMGGADDGDFVELQLVKGSRGRPEGKVEKILKRSRTQLVAIARFFSGKPVGFAQSGNRVIEVLLDIPKNIVVEDFDRVVVQITRYREKPNDLMQGKVIRNHGKENATDAEMQSILADKGFPLEWNQKILTDLDAISEEVHPEDKRRDFRDLITFTIDPFDAKDFDDALSFKELEDGKCEVGVHIADVAHYVQADSAMDKEAMYRGNSVYLVDRVVPMLPEKLSNHLCSLRPNEDKYSFSVLFTLDANKSITGHWIGKGLIHSKKRYTYENAQVVLEGSSDPFEKELRKLNEIAKHYRKLRLDHGAIDFDSEEVKFRLNEEGMPVSLEVKERKEAHMLIEEFMLLANKYVATFIHNKMKEPPGIPFVYRIHDNPDPDKLEQFQTFAKELGVYLDFSTPKKISKSLNRISELAREDEKFKILQPLAIRAMAKAAYSTENIGHYGLGFPNYAHFTSPIRRYADLMVHRILHGNLDGNLRMDARQLERICDHISNQERKAMEAERLSSRYFQVLYLKNRVGESFDGRIVGMNDRGFFVELVGSGCEGFLPFGQVQEDIELHSSRMKARSESTSTNWHFGDKIKIKLVDADLNQKELLLAVLD